MRSLRSNLRTTILVVSEGGFAVKVARPGGVVYWLRRLSSVVYTTSKVDQRSVVKTREEAERLIELWVSA